MISHRKYKKVTNVSNLQPACSNPGRPTDMFLSNKPRLGGDVSLKCITAIITVEMVIPVIISQELSPIMIINYGGEL